jgi:hypothetical protein
MLQTAQQFGVPRLKQCFVYIDNCTEGIPSIYGRQHSGADNRARRKMVSRNQFVDIVEISRN